ncbi:MAG: hypothetical protein E7591_00480 [Ruminococcaceae bacterium]|nr:hypothetical protein [Oscillospiraceae bacterium]
MKKILSLLLVITMLFSTVSFFTAADSEKELPFIDVDEKDWFYTAVKYSYDNGIFKGTNEEGTLFSPFNVMTRAQFATTLFRFAGVNEDSYSGATGFTDVPEGKWMSAAVKWAAEKGYVKGTGEGKFDPTGALNRQQLATMLYRFASFTFDTSKVDKDILINFADGEKVASWAEDAAVWAASENILKGNEKGDLLPFANATRAQVAQILLNFESFCGGTDADSFLNKDIVLSVNNAKYTEAKNIIFMIGDGMGFGIVEMTEYLYKDDLYKGKLAMNYIAQKSAQTTYSQNDQVTDSAAGGTALATGHKTENDFVSISPDGKIDYMTTLELAASKGKSTGVVATKSVTDATPASFTAHSVSRQNHSEIGIQQLDKLMDGTLDILMGSGIKYYRGSDDIKAKLAEAKDAGVNYTESFDSALDMELPVLGLFDTYMEMDTTNPENPTIEEMTSLALDKLSEDENGFFLMVEGSQIDTYSHNMQLEYAAYECYHFDRAVARVLDFISKNPDTVLIITADHETGGIIRPCEVNEETADSTYYTSGSHSSRSVPVYAVGYGVEKLNRLNENVDLAIFVAELLGEDDFGTKSVNKNLIVGDNADDISVIAKENEFSEATDDGLLFTFDGNTCELTIPAEAFNTDPADIKNSRAIHVEITNAGDDYLTVPSLFLYGSLFAPTVEFIKAGDTVTVSYIISTGYWEDNFFADIDYITLCQTEPIFDFDPTVARMLLGDIYVTDRGLDD